MKENQSNKVLKYSILFILLCFIAILTIGLSQSFEESEKPIEEQQELKDDIELPEQDNEEDIEQEESDPTPQETTPLQEDIEEDDTSMQDENIEEETPLVEQVPETQEIPETQEVEEKEEIPTYMISISIQGVNQTIAQGTIEVIQDSSVYDVLEKYTESISMEIITSGLGSSVYVKGINGLHEFDYGGRSGWTYTVNGEFVNKGSGSCKVEDGDNVEWIYTGYE